MIAPIMRALIKNKGALSQEQKVKLKELVKSGEVSKPDLDKLKALSVKIKGIQKKKPASNSPNKDFISKKGKALSAPQNNTIASKRGVVDSKHTPDDSTPSSFLGESKGGWGGTDNPVGKVAADGIPKRILQKNDGGRKLMNAVAAKQGVKLGKIKGRSTFIMKATGKEATPSQKKAFHRAYTKAIEKREELMDKYSKVAEKRDYDVSMRNR